MKKKQIMAGFGIGILCNITFLIICFHFFSNDHAKIEDLVLKYSGFYFGVVLVASFIRRYFVLGLLIAFFIPVLIFIILQILVILAYRGIIH